MLPMFLAFAVSLTLTLLVIRYQKAHAGLTHDNDFSGPQKFHRVAVPRVGGLGITAGVLAASLLLLAIAPSDHHAWIALALLGCGVPAFGAGLVEDLTKRVSPRQRLLFTAISAALASALLSAKITYTAIPGLDWVVSTTAGAFAVTIFAVVGVANSVNIIDGFNGLASMCAMIMLCAVAYVAFQVQDPLVATMALIGVGAVLGFFCWNFPGGLIFLGDGGAYFLGFYIAELSILLLARNPTVSPLFPLLVCVYPVFETLFSIYRRRVLRAVPPSMPDGIHLHSLIYRRLLRWAVGGSSAKALTRRNSMTSPFLWLLCMLSVMPAIMFWDNAALLGLALALFGVSYVVLYWRIVRFKSPRWMRVLAGRRRSTRSPSQAGRTRS